MTRDLDPQFITKEVIMARILFNDRYAKQSLGQVGFWESLTPSEKKTVSGCVDSIENCKLRSMPSA